MTYKTILSAMVALQKLVGQNLHLRQAYQLSKIVEKANKELKFYSDKNAEIMASDKTNEEKIKMVNELLDLKIDWGLDPIVFSFDDDVKLSADDLLSSHGIIEIQE